MKDTAAGLKELEHTADWQLHAWAPDLRGLLEQAARGMYALSGMRLQPAPAVERKLEIQAQDGESLLVRFLAELLYFCFEENLGFDTFILRLNDCHLHAHMKGYPVASIDKEIKAVTYHNLAIHKTENGLEVEVVFDV